MNEAETNQESLREWIEARYGPVTFKRQTVFVAVVPVCKGAAVGTGATWYTALLALKRDLTDPVAQSVETSPE